MIIEVKIKQLYGKTFCYPVSKDAEFLCKLMGRPTLTIDQLVMCREHGFEVITKMQEVSLDDFINPKS